MVTQVIYLIKQDKKEQGEVDIPMLLKELGVKEADSNHPVYKEQPFLIFTSLSTKNTKSSQDN